MPTGKGSDSEEKDGDPKKDSYDRKMLDRGSGVLVVSVGVFVLLCLGGLVSSWTDADTTCLPSHSGRTALAGNGSFSSLDNEAAAATQMHFARLGNSVEVGDRDFWLLAVRGHDRSGLRWVSNVLNSVPEIAMVGDFMKPFLISSSPKKLLDFVGAYPKSVEEGAKDIYARMLLEAARTYSGKDKRDPHSAHLVDSVSWIGEHTPWRVAEPYIAEMPIVYIVRDVRDVVVSQTFQFLETCSRDEEKCSLYNELPSLRAQLQQKVKAHQGDARYFREHPMELYNTPDDQKWVSHMATQWQNFADQDKELDRLSVRVHTLLYEDLLMDFEQEVAAILRFIGMDHKQFKVPMLFAPRELRRASVPTWKPHATPQFVRAISQSAQRGLEFYSYEVSAAWASMIWTQPKEEAPAQPGGNEEFQNAEQFGPPRRLQEEEEADAAVVSKEQEVPLKNVSLELSMPDGAGWLQETGPYVSGKEVVAIGSVGEDATEVTQPRRLWANKPESCVCTWTRPPPNATFAMGLLDWRRKRSGGKSEDDEINTGNHVWRYGALNLLAPSIWPSLETDTNLALTPGERHHIARLYVGTGPMLTPAKEFFSHRKRADEIQKVVNQLDRKMVMVGLGIAKVPLSRDGHRDLDTRRNVDVQAVDVQLHPGHLAFLADVEARTPGAIGVRGEFTEAVLKRHGFTRFRDTGCPSLFLNLRPGLGMVLERKYVNLRSEMQRPDFRCAVMPPTWYAPELMRLLLNLVRRWPGSLIIFQSVQEKNLMQRASEDLNISVPDNVTRIYQDVHQWKNELASVQLVVGQRMLGTMVAIWAETPVITFATDWRSKELCESMKLACVDIFNKNTKAGQPLKAVYNAAQNFNGHDFDRRRSQIAKTYAAMFETAGLEINPAVLKVR